MNEPMPKAALPTAPSRMVLKHLCVGAAHDSTLPASLRFVAMWPGVEMAPLYGFDDQGRTSPTTPAAALIRYAKGASVPAHAHPGYEHVIVLEGSQRDKQHHYAQGSCSLQAPGSQHQVWSDEGCLVLAIWNRPVTLLK